jgi:hypothetical protein
MDLSQQARAIGYHSPARQRLARSITWLPEPLWVAPSRPRDAGVAPCRLDHGRVGGAFYFAIHGLFAAIFASAECALRVGVIGARHFMPSRAKLSAVPYEALCPSGYARPAPMLG